MGWGNICDQTVGRLSDTAQGPNIARLIGAHFQDADRMGLHQLEKSKRETDGCIVITLCGVHSKLSIENMSQ